MSSRVSQAPLTLTVLTEHPCQRSFCPHMSVMLAVHPWGHSLPGGCVLSVSFRRRAGLCLPHWALGIVLHTRQACITNLLMGCLDPRPRKIRIARSTQADQDGRFALQQDPSSLDLCQLWTVVVEWHCSDVMASSERVTGFEARERQDSWLGALSNCMNRMSV